MARPGGLGRGLGALIPTGVVSNDEIGLQDIPISSIRPNPQQPREHFDEESLAALAESIREVGVLQPVLVRPGGDGFELIAGERRWRAARRIGLQTIPAIVRTADDASMLQQAIVENVQREELNPLEEAAAYQQLIEDFSLTHDDVALRVGKSRTTITNTLRLLQLPPSIQRHLKERALRMGHAARAARHARPRVPGAARQARGRRGPLGPRGRGGDPARARSRSRRSRRRPRAAKLRPPGLLELEELLGDYLETRVRISMSPRRGRVEVEFATLEDLERIYRVITDGRRARRDLSDGPARSAARRRPVARCRGGHRPPTRRASSGPRDAERRARPPARRARRARTRPRPCGSRAGAGRCGRPARRRGGAPTGAAR